MSVSESVSNFEDHITGREVNEDTAVRYGRWCRRFEAWRPGGDPDEEMLRDFDTFLEDEKRPDYSWENSRGRAAPASYSHRTRVSALSACKLWLRHNYDTEIVTDIQDIALGEPAPFDPTIIPPAEIERTIENAAVDCSNPDCKTAIRVGYDAIMRGAELADVRAEDVDRSEQTLYVRAKKGSEPKHIDLGTKAWAALERHVEAHPDREYLFRNSYGRAWRPASWNQHFRRKHHEAGFHAFSRHSAITNRLRDGEDFGQVYLRARHRHPSTTTKYASVAGVDTPGWVSDI